MEKNCYGAEKDIKQNTDGLKIKNTSKISLEKTIPVLNDDEMSRNNSKDVQNLSNHNSKDNINNSSDQTNLEVNNGCEMIDNASNDSTLNNQKSINVINVNYHQKELEKNIVDSKTCLIDKDKFDIKEKLQLEKEVKQLKLCLEEKEKQLETAAKYGITILQNNESLQAFIDKKEEEVKIKMEVS